MAEKRYNANATTDWFTSTNWTPQGVPVTGDTVIFDASSASCALTSGIDGVSLRFDGGYPGTFNAAGHPVSINGFLIPVAIAGVINLQDVTVTNFGDVDLRGIPTGRLILTRSHWIQRGGTVANPNSYLDVSDTTERNFASLTFDVDSVTTIDRRLFYTSVFIDGAIVGVTNRIGTNRNTAAIEIGEYGSLSGTSTGYVHIWSGSLSGHTDNIHLREVYLRNNASKIGVNCRFSIPVIFAIDGGTNAVQDVGDGCVFGQKVTVQSIVNGAITVNFSRSVFSGDFLARNTAGGSVSITGSIAATGTANQTIDIAQAHLDGGAATHIELAKPSGSLTIHASSAVCMAGRQSGLLKLSGIADYTVCGDLELFSEPDTSELAGTFTPGPGTVAVRHVYADHFYTAKLYVQSNVSASGVNISELRVIQDAGQL